MEFWNGQGIYPGFFVLEIIQWEVVFVRRFGKLGSLTKNICLLRKCVVFLIYQKGNKMFIVRQSNHIQEDLKRNWSSWNYGLEGIKASAEQIEEWKEEAVKNEKTFYISGFELWGDEIMKAEIGELYPGYWVLIDLNRGWGLSCNILKAESIEDAIKEVTAYGFRIELGEGQTVDCSKARVVYSSDDIHIIEVL